jgi:peptidoglycan/LPS O-acetylase OafA/YrhL
MSSAAKTRIPDLWSVLALLRFLLAAVVAVNHLADFTSLGVLGWIPRFGAFEAILGFLLISGFSITESYKKAPQAFFFRRAMRIYPVYLAAIGITYLVNPESLGWAFLGILLLNVLFLNQLFTTGSYVGPAWSLALEVWLYALVPVFSRLKEKRIVVLAALSFCFYVVYTCGRSLFDWVYYSGVGAGLNLLTLSFMWLLGHLLSRSASKLFVLKLIGLTFAAHLGLSVAIQTAYRFKNHALELLGGDAVDWAFRAVSLGVVFVCFWYFLAPREATSAEPHAVRAGRKFTTFRFLGDISYPLYLVHIPVYSQLARWGGGGRLA